MSSRSIGETHGCPLTFLHLREHHASKLSWGSNTPYTSFLSNRLDRARNLYRRDLFAHFGCVNAIEFSNEGYMLISGGDDRRVLLWSLESSMSGHCNPTPMKEEHSSNIFCLGFDSSNSKIFSAGNDEQVIVHDVKTREAVNVFMHEEAIYGVSVNPYVDSIFASAGEDGQILIFDIRAPPLTDPLLLARSYDAFHAVQFHPLDPKFVVTANSKEGVVLWDVRKPRVPFLKYGEKRSAESSMCARFNSNGSQIVALRRRMHPVLYNTGSSSPVCEFDADHYYNSCTMKSCCFAGSRDQFVLSGSDDFNLYMWRIPDPQSEVNFVSDAHLILKGHRSIVNQVRFNSHNFTIASSGVEKIVKLWSPVLVPGSYGTLGSESSESTMNRRVYTHEDYIGLVLDSGQTVSHDYSHGNTEEDPKMMAFFDSLVQRELEGWTTNTDLSDDDLDVGTPSNSGAAPNQSSSLITSQSDDTDSDSAWASPLPSPFGPRRRYPFAPRISPIRHNDARSSSPSDRPKPAQGSEWILRLIAKKRAQLKAAKRKRRNVKKQKKLKPRQFIQCYTTSSRQYLYRPENNTRRPLRRSNGTYSDLMRRRHTVAPYTMMCFGNLGESEEESDDEKQTDRGGGPPPATGVSVEEGQSSSRRRERIPSNSQSLSQRNLYEMRFWSSDSSTTEEDESGEGKRRRGESSGRRRRTVPEEEEQDDDEEDTRSTASCHLGDSVVSEIVEAETEGSANGANSVSSLRSGAGRSAFVPTGRVTRARPHGDRISNDSDRAGLVSMTPALSPPSHGAQEVMIPISGISTDDRGSVLFDLTPPTSFESPTFDLLNRVDFQESSGLISRNVGSNSNTSNYSNRALPDLSVGVDPTLEMPPTLSAAVKNSRQDPKTPYSRKKKSSENRKRSHGARQCRKQQSTLVHDDKESYNILSNGDDTLTTPEEGGSSSPTTVTSIANGTSSDGGSASTPDSGISVGDKSEKGAPEESGSESHGGSSTPVAPFKRKRIPEFRLKSYRPRVSDDEEDADDL